MATVELVASTTVTIPNGQLEATDSIRTGHWTEFEIVTPAGMPANTLVFKVSLDDVTYQPWPAGQFSISGGNNYLAPDELSRWPYFKICTSNAVAANETFTVSASK